LFSLFEISAKRQPDAVRLFLANEMNGNVHEILALYNGLKHGDNVNFLALLKKILVKALKT